MNDPTPEPGSVYRDSPAAPSTLDSDLRRYWHELVARRGVFLGVLAVTVAAGMLVTFLSTPEYRATTILHIEREGPAVVTFRDVTDVDSTGYSGYAGYRDYYQTQYRIIESRSVLRLAAERLDLANRPEYAQRRAPLASRVWRRISETLFGAKARAPDTGGSDRLIGFVRRGLSVEPVAESQLVKISFVDRDPGLAADVANAVGEAYRFQSLSARYDTTGEAREFLTKDVARVQGEIAGLERTLQAYATEHGILGLDDGSVDISERSLADLSDRLTEARGELARAEAEHRAVSSADPQALPEVLSSAVIGELRRERSELEREVARMSERFGPSWPRLAQLREEVREADAQLERETERIAERVRAVAVTRLERAAAEEQELRELLDASRREVERVKLATIEYAGLKAEIDSKRRILADLVGRQNETETTYRLRETGTSNIRVVDAAETPKAPFRPRVMLNLLLSILLGCTFGVAAALLIAHLDDTVKGDEDIRKLTGLSVLGHVPEAGSLQLAEARGESRDPTRSRDLASLLEPRGSFAESFRSLRTSLLLASPDHPPRHLVITSCEPGDGKSTVAANLAITLAQLGRRVLLVDADMRRARLHKVWDADDSVGLSSYLSGNAPVGDLERPTDVPGLTLITSGPIPPNPAELLGSNALPALLEHFVEVAGVDHVVFDATPVLTVTDAALIAAHVDATVLVARARVTRRDALAHAAARLRGVHARVTGVVLNAVEVAAGYYYRRYYRYDRESPGAEPAGRRTRFQARDSAGRRVG